MNEASVSSLSNADFETPVTAETPIVEPQQIDTAYEKPDPALDQTSGFDQTETSANSTDLDSISSSKTPTIDVTASIPDTQLESDSLNPLTVSDESVTGSMEAEPVKPSDIEEKNEIDRETQENASRQTGADGEQPLKAEPVENSSDSALSALNLPAEGTDPEKTSSLSDTGENSESLQDKEESNPQP